MNVRAVQLPLRFLIVLLKGAQDADLQALATHLRQSLVRVIEAFAGHGDSLETLRRLVLFRAPVFA